MWRKKYQILNTIINFEIFFLQALPSSSIPHRPVPRAQYTVLPTREETSSFHAAAVHPEFLEPVSALQLAMKWTFSINQHRPRQAATHKLKHHKHLSQLRQYQTVIITTSINFMAIIHTSPTSTMGPMAVFISIRRLQRPTRQTPPFPQVLQPAPLVAWHIEVCIDHCQIRPEGESVSVFSLFAFSFAAFSRSFVNEADRQSPMHFNICCRLNWKFLFNSSKTNSPMTCL